MISKFLKTRLDNYFKIFYCRYDNAQRLDETGYGVKLNPYEFTAEQLLVAIEKLLSDNELQTKLKTAAERIQARDSHLELAKKIENMVALEKQ